MADVKFKCPHCVGPLLVDEGAAGLTVPCPHCGANIVIPEASREAPTKSTAVSTDSPRKMSSAAGIASFILDLIGLSPAAKLCRAARRGDLATVRQLISQNPDVSLTTTTRRSSPLHEAARKGQEDVVNLFLEMGANVNAPNKFGVTPLHYAVLGNHQGLVEALLARGANVDARAEKCDGIYECTPLLLATRDGHLQAAKVLLANGADPNPTSDGYFGPLHHVVRSKNIELLQLLLSYGADIHARVLTLTPLHMTATLGWVPGTLLLLEYGADVHARGEKGFTPLHLAAIRSDAAAIPALLQAGADPNARSEWGWTPLHVAADNGSLAAAEMLLMNGADPRAKNVEGWSGTTAKNMSVGRVTTEAGFVARYVTSDVGSVGEEARSKAVGELDLMALMSQLIDKYSDVRKAQPQTDPRSRNPHILRPKVKK